MPWVLVMIFKHRYKTLYFNSGHRVKYLANGLAFMWVPCMGVYFSFLFFLDIQSSHKPNFIQLHSFLAWTCEKC